MTYSPAWIEWISANQDLLVVFFWILPWVAQWLLAYVYARGYHDNQTALSKTLVILLLVCGPLGVLGAVGIIIWAVAAQPSRSDPSD